MFNFFKFNNTCFSDTFLWRSDGFNTRVLTQNTASLFYPEENYQTKIIMTIYDKQFKKLKTIKKIIKKFDNFEYIFDSFNHGKDYGVFTLFHLIEKNPNKLSFIDSSTIGYKLNNKKIYSCVHRNHNFNSINAGFLNQKNPFKIINSKEFTNYSPQLYFDDCRKCEITLKNETNKDSVFKIKYLDLNRKIIFIDEFIIKKKHILIYELKKDFLYRYIDIFSNLSIINKNDPNGSKGIINRPLIFKYFDSNFDVLHA